MFNLFKSKRNDGLKENSSIIGRVTVIKNAGRPDEQILALNKKNLLTDAGRDYIIDAMYVDESASKVACSFVGVSTNATAPDDADTTLTGEITTGGLTRVNATTNTHTGGTNTATVQHTFTASATHTNVQKCALFTAVSGGTMVHENTFTAASLVSGDTLQVTWTITVDDV